MLNETTYGILLSYIGSIHIQLISNSPLINLLLASSLMINSKYSIFGGRVCRINTDMFLDILWSCVRSCPVSSQTFTCRIIQIFRYLLLSVFIIVWHMIFFWVFKEETAIISSNYLSLIRILSLSPNEYTIELEGVSSPSSRLRRHRLTLHLRLPSRLSLLLPV